MLYIVLKDSTEIMKHVCEPIFVDPGTVLEIQADGDELGRILMQCQNIPRTNSAVQRWFGDMAEFILFNAYARECAH